MDDRSLPRVEKMMGVVKAYRQLKAVIATKTMASAHAMLQYRREQKKHGEKKPERAEEVPISPGEPLRVKVNGAH